MKYIFALFLVFVSLPAQAEIFAWKDPKFNITLSYPDDWMAQAKEGDYLRLYVVAPQGQDHAACRVMASNDNRFLYVPPKASVEVSKFMQDETVLKGIFANYLHYDNVSLSGYDDISSLGRGPATMALASFTKEWNGKTYPMNGIVFGGYSQGLETVFECEALSQSWDKWRPLFLNMVETFDFPARTSSAKNGYYRDFMADGYVFFPVGDHQGKSMY